jgi:transposase
MKKRNDKQVIFKPYVQNQLSAIPPTYEELVPVNHPVRVINKVLDKIDTAPLLRLYKPGGASNYHPVMLLKVLVYAYVNNIYSSRKIEAALQESIYFRWLSGDNQPDHNTINRFRSDRLKDVLRNIFTQVVQLLAEEGALNIKELYTDGTRIEANANRYTLCMGQSHQYQQGEDKKAAG